MKKKLTAIFVLLAVCLGLIVLPQTAFAQSDQKDYSLINLEETANNETLSLNTTRVQSDGIVPFEYTDNVELPQSCRCCLDHPVTLSCKAECNGCRNVRRSSEQNWELE